jgi:hypothetical protein
LIEEASDHAAHEGHGNEYREDGERGGHHRQSDFLRAFQRSAPMALAHVHMTHDVLTYHDGVVDQQTDA